MQLDHFNVLRSLFLCLHSCIVRSWLFKCVREETQFCVHHEGKPPLPYVESCSTLARENQTIVADLDGTLTRSSSSFPYFMLVAFEAGSPLRGMLLLLFSPLIWLLYNFVSEATGVHLLIFLSLAGIKASDVEGVSRAVLSKFYLEDLHPCSYKVLLTFQRRCIVTASPRIMVEPFLKEYLEVDHVIGTELHLWGGYCTGLLSGSGVLVGLRKREVVRRMYRGRQPDVGLGDRPTDYAFLSLCKEAYIVPRKHVEAVTKEQYVKPLVFHDGRLVIRPTPLAALFIFLWLPVGFLLAVTRMVIGVLLPLEIAAPLTALLGLRIRVKGAPPIRQQGAKKGMLYVCTHRTLLDPIFLSVALRRRVTAVTYSLSRFSEMLSPIKTVRLTRCRTQDAETIHKLLQEGDLIICPEGTTCRERFLLRFSSLFAELTNDIVPVTMEVRMDLFHGSTARGYKAMDPFFFFMNLRPQYTVSFLECLPKEETCAGGKSSCEVANFVQCQMAYAMGYECTDFTRKDKYRVLAGNDGTVPAMTKERSMNTKVCALEVSKFVASWIKAIEG